MKKQFLDYPNQVQRHQVMEILLEVLTITSPKQQLWQGKAALTTHAQADTEYQQKPNGKQNAKAGVVTMLPVPNFHLLTTPATDTILEDYLGEPVVIGQVPWMALGLNIYGLIA